MRKKAVPILCLLLVTLSSIGQDTLFLQSLMQQDTADFGHYLSYPDSFRIQILYTQIDRDKKNRPHFREFSYRLNGQEYFYPASTVKMPVAFLALEKLDGLRKKYPALNKETTMLTDSSFAGQDVVYNQPVARDGRPTIADYIRQVFLVSDNNAFNRLYEFVGQDEIQSRLAAKGYPDVMIRHRLNITRTPEQNRHTNPVLFYDTSGKRLYSQPAAVAQHRFPPLPVALGNGFDSAGVVVPRPFDFSQKNRIYLSDETHILRSVLFPNAVPDKQKFHLTDDDYTFLRRWMSSYPRESDYPYYDSASYPDTYCKFLYYGAENQKTDPGIRIFNKTGDAYGFLIDIAYIADFTHKIEFMLSAVISCNTDGIFNDDHYDYERVGYPFMKNLGRKIYQFELQRKRSNPPDLSHFVMDYTQP